MNLVFYFINARNVVEFSAHSAMFNEGDAGTTMYVLLEGMAKIVVAGRSVEIAGPGDIFGEMALIDDAPRSATVIARTHCRAVKISRSEFDLLIREKPAFARHVMKIMVKRLRNMNRASYDAAAPTLTAAKSALAP